jgi:uncharacterized membrane protein
LKLEGRQAALLLMRTSGLNLTLLKSATYCVMHFCVAIVVAYALTRDWRAALAIGLIEPFVQTFFFALHDRFWARYDGRRARSAPIGPDTHGGLEPARVYAAPPARR